jgi:peptide/nickel transport system substrate-binding protein
MKTLRQLFPLLFAAAIAFVAISCAPAATPQVVTEKATVILKETVQVVVTATPAPVRVEPKVLNVVQASDATSLDPTAVTGVETSNVNNQIFDGLVRMDANMQLTPMLAESWEMKDAQNFTLHLRKGVKFHDGSDFTAKDVKFTLDRILDPATKSTLRSYIAFVDKVDIVDDYTVLVHTSQPYVTLMKQMARGVLIVPKDAFEKMGAEAFATNPVGSGPFKFVRWVKDQEVVLDANRDYWQGPPKVDQVIIRPIAESSTRLAALLTGEADIVSGLPYEQLDIVQASKTAKLEKAKGLTIQFLAFNTFKPPLDDVRVRKAINYAIDKELILKTVLKGYGVVNNGPFSPLSFGYNPDQEGYPYDPEKAKALLAEAGYAQGIDLSLVYESGSSISADDLSVQAIAEQLRKVGIRVTLQPTERAQIIGPIVTGGAMEQMGLMNCRDALGDADFCTGLWFDPGRRSFYYNTPELTQLINEELTLVDPDQRLKKLYEVGKYIVDDAGIGFLYTPDLFYATSSRVRGFEARGDRLLYLYPVSVGGT